MADMSEDLQNLGTSRGGGGAGGFGYNAWGTLVGFDINADSTKTKPNAQDRIILDLQRPTLGFNASPEDPVQIVARVEGKPPAATPAGGRKPRTPMGIIHVRDGRDAAKETMVGDYVMLKDIEKAGEIYKARRVEVAVRNYNPQKHRAFSGLFSVRPEREKKGKDGEPYFSQSRIGLLPFADIVASEGELRERALQAISDAANTHGARPYFVLRAIQENPETKKCHFSIAREIGLYDPETQTEYTPEDAISRFISGEDGNNGPKILQYLGGQALFEVIPQFRVNTGGSSLPSSKRQNAQDNGSYDPKNEWRYDDGANLRFMEGERLESGYAMMDVMLQRLPSRERPGEWSGTHTIFCEPQRPIQPLFKLSEIITPNLSKELTADLLRKGDKRAKELRMAKKAAKAPENAGEAADAEQDAGYAPVM